MATIPWLADVLREAGLPVVEQGDWRNRMRAGSFDPIGVLWHHTGSTSSPSNPHPSLNTVIVGRGGDDPLPGPLCHALVDYNGVFHIISAGRANHAGTARASGPIPAGDGNTMLIGWEIDYQGITQAMTPAQYANSVKGTAAVLRRLGRDASYARGHRETSITGKPDPGFVNLDQMRADVAAAMAGPPPGPSQRPGNAGGLAVAWAVGRVDVFGRAEDGRVMHNYFQRGDAGGGFPGWRALAGSGGSRCQPVAVSHYMGRLDVFTYNSGSRLAHWYFDRLEGSVWRGPFQRGDTTFQGSPAVVCFDPGRVDVFGRDTYNELRHGYYTTAGENVWHPFETLAGGRILAGDPTVVQWHVGRWDVFAVGTDNRMKHWYFDRLTDAVWHGPENIGSVEFARGAPAAVSYVAGRIDLFARDTGNRLRHTYVDQMSGTRWPAWELLPTSGDIAGNPVAVSRYNGRLDVFAVTTSGIMRQWWFDRLGAATWQTGTMDNTTFSTAPGTSKALAWEPGRLDVFGIDTNDNMRHRYYQHPGPWSGWNNLEGIFQ